MHKLSLFFALMSIICLQHAAYACAPESKLSTLLSAVLSNDLGQLAKALNKEKIHQVAKELVKLDSTKSSSRYRREAEHAEGAEKHNTVSLDEAVITVARLINSAMDNMESVQSQPIPVGRSTVQASQPVPTLKDHIVRNSRSSSPIQNSAQIGRNAGQPVPVNSAEISSNADNNNQ